MAFSLAPRTQLVIACAAVVLAFYLGYGLRYLASLPAGPSWWHFPLAFVIGGGIGAAFVIGHFGNRLFRQESSEQVGATEESSGSTAHEVHKRHVQRGELGGQADGRANT